MGRLSKRTIQCRAARRSRDLKEGECGDGWLWQRDELAQHRQAGLKQGLKRFSTWAYT